MQYHGTRVDYLYGRYTYAYSWPLWRRNVSLLHLYINNRFLSADFLKGLRHHQQLTDCLLSVGCDESPRLVLEHIG